jgi:hypothetical protein
METERPKNRQAVKSKTVKMTVLIAAVFGMVFGLFELVATQQHEYPVSCTTIAWTPQCERDLDAAYGKTRAPSPCEMSGNALDCQQTSNPRRELIREDDNHVRKPKSNH